MEDKKNVNHRLKLLNTSEDLIKFRIGHKKPVFFVHFAILCYSLLILPFAEKKLIIPCTSKNKSQTPSMHTFMGICINV